jgi:MerR family mercuric resistance operon transcriptional regulator
VQNDEGPSDPLTIGKVAARAGVGVETIRFYERKGLIRRPVRRSRGFRRYPADAVERVTFIRGAKDLGFSLREIQDLLSIRDERGATCADMRERARAKIVDVDARIDSLRRMRKTLATLMHTCDGTAPVAKCPIVISLKTAHRAGGHRAQG